MIDDMCDQVAGLMETCTMRIADRLHDLRGTVRWRCCWTSSCRRIVCATQA
jgi:hypothetical protein